MKIFKNILLALYALFLFTPTCSLPAAHVDVAIPEKLSDSNVIRVMTYNVRREGPETKPEREWSNRLPLLCNEIADLNPDIFGLQESTKNQIDEIADCLATKGLSYTFFGEGRGESWGGKGANEYNPIFYNPTLFELIDSGTFFINEVESIWGRWMPWHYKETGWLPRIATWGKFKHRITDQEFYFYNTHFDHQYPEARLRCAIAVAQHQRSINVEQLPVIITGDLNTRFVGDVRDTLNEFKPALETAAIVGGPKETETGWTNDKLKEIDHILINDKVEALRHFVIVYKGPVLASDHRPVIADLRFISS